VSVLVDSSVWIDAAKVKDRSRKTLSSLINGSDVICYTDPIQTEVCQGAKSQLEFEKLWDAFKGFQILRVRDHHWELAAWNYFRCRKAGLTIISTIDCLIATIAQSYRVPLWAMDKLFMKMQPVIDFNFYK